MRRPVVVVIAAAFAVGSLTGIASGATANDADCRKVAATAQPASGVNSAEVLAYDACRFDKLDAAVKAGSTPTPGDSPTVAKPTATPTDSPAPSVTPTTDTPSPTVEPTSASPTPTPTATTPPAGGTMVLGRSFPNAATTGVPDAIKPSLTKYTGSCTISSGGPVTIDRKIITCDQFRLLVPGITITNSVINGTVYSDCCYMNGGFSLVDSEVHGPNEAATVVGEARFKLLRVEVTGGSRSVNCNSECDVRDSYIHAQYKDLRGIDHESGIRQDSHGTFVGNNIACDAIAVANPNGGEGSGCSAAISGYGDFGTVNNNNFTGNLISSGQSDDGQPASSYCIYGGSTPGKPYPNAHDIVFKDNILKRGSGGKCGIYGPVTSFDSKASGSVWSGNVFDDGKPVPAAN